MLINLTGCIWNCLDQLAAADVLWMILTPKTYSFQKILLVAEATEMTIFVTVFTLILSCRTLEPFCMFGISTRMTSIFSLMDLAMIEFFLVGWLLLIVITWVPLVTIWSGLVMLLFPLGFSWWELCSLMPHNINLGHLGVTWNCFNVSSSWLWGFHLLGNLSYLAAENVSKSMLESLMVLETNSSSFKENEEISLCKILAVSGG